MEVAHGRAVVAQLDKAAAASKVGGRVAGLQAQQIAVVQDRLAKVASLFSGLGVQEQSVQLGGSHIRVRDLRAIPVLDSIAGHDDARGGVLGRGCGELQTLVVGLRLVFRLLEVHREVSGRTQRAFRHRRYREPRRAVEGKGGRQRARGTNTENLYRGDRSGLLEAVALHQLGRSLNGLWPRRGSPRWGCRGLGWSGLACR